MKNKQLKKRLREILESSGTSIRKVVAESALDYTGNIKGFFNDLAEHGCISGMVSQLVYYYDTHAFYNLHYAEIEELRYEYEENLGMELKPKGDLMNWYAWFAFEEVARLLYEEISECSEFNENLDCTGSNSYSNESDAQIVNIVPFNEVSIRYTRPHIDAMPNVKSSRESSQLLRKYISADTLDHKERFWVMLMIGTKVLGISEIGRGSGSGVVVHTSEIFQMVILSNAKNFIIAHNHPSGTLRPSENDKRMTNKIKNLSKELNVILSDHLILTSEKYYSFNDEGLLH